MTVPIYEVRLTRDAVSDLEALYDCISTNRSPDQADDLLESLLERVATLEAFPMRGAVPKELDALGMTHFRQILLNPYRLFYEIVEMTVYVTVIADGRRDIQALLERRLLGR